MTNFTSANLEAVSIESKDGNADISIAVLPRQGMNLKSFIFNGREFIHFNPGVIADTGYLYTGAFHLFPTPCRLRNARYTFQGRDIIQNKYGHQITIHGLVHNERFDISNTHNSITGILEITKDHPVYEGFPFEGKLTLHYELLSNGLEVKFIFENRSDSPAPVGYGIHPYWRVPQQRDDVFLQIPAENIMELSELIPTGKLIPLADTDFDFRQYRSLADLFFDAVYFPLQSTEETGIIFKNEAVKLRFEASDNMKHFIYYAPKGEPFVCLENLSCAPNAPNLYNDNYITESGLTIIEPNDSLHCEIRYIIEYL